jgi:hypothetical protein
MSESKHITKSEFYSTIGGVYMFIGIYYILPTYGDYSENFLGGLQGLILLVVPMALSIYFGKKGRKEGRKDDNI